MWASVSSFHHSWLYYCSSLAIQKRNSEADAIRHVQKSFVLLNKQSTGIIQPVEKYLLSCNLIWSHNLNNCYTAITKSETFQPEAL
jgi:hypothetical protein